MDAVIVIIGSVCALSAAMLGLAHLMGPMIARRRLIKRYQRQRLDLRRVRGKR